MHLLSLFLSLSLLLRASAAPPGLTIPTQQGSVTGTLVSPTVRQFLGIPYATAQRWQPPQLPPNRTRTFNANRFGDSCFQNLVPLFADYLRVVGAGETLDVPTSEDCLSVNIWSPSVERLRGKRKAAVLIWIYGGGFIVGTSNTRFYTGQNIVSSNDDIIVVSFNYRLDVFGQPNAPQLGSDNRNFGLLDIKAAVHWVHNNIAEFGGDPERITLFGHSAGAQAADLYAFANPGDTFVKGIIPQSGTVSGSALIDRVQTDSMAWTTVATAVGCGNAATPAQFTCMRNINPRTLINAVISTGTIFDRIVDNVTDFANIPDRVASGQFLKAAFLVGNTQNEADSLLVATQLSTANRILPGLTQAISEVQSLVSTCPSGTAAVRRRTAGVPVWRYQYQGIFPNLRLYPEMRAYHHAEIPMIFGTYGLSTLRPGVKPTADQAALSRYVQRAWVAFARDPQRGLLGLGWPQYDPETKSIAQLGNPVYSPTGVTFAQGSLVDWACTNQTELVQVQSQLFGIVLRP